MSIVIPKDFEAVVFTPPARVDHHSVPQILEATERAGIQNLIAHRILHLHQVEHIDSAAVAGLLDIIRRATEFGREFVACDPPPIVRSYLDIYGAAPLFEGRVLNSADDGTYQSDVLPFVPPFVPNRAGRLDIYKGGAVRSYQLAGDELREISPVDLNTHPAKVPTRALAMGVHAGANVKVVEAIGYVMLRRHMCGCDATHKTFDALHQLHGWYRNKGFDFSGLELWASDIPAGIVTERLTFRDRMHLDQFRTLLRIDESWKKIGAPQEDVEEEYYYLYANSP